MANLILVLGDQLSLTNNAIKYYQDGDTILMMEVLGEATYVPHHKKKLVFIFSAMRHFATTLEDKGYNVKYIKINDKDNKGSFVNNINELSLSNYEKLIVCFPGEYRVLEDLRSLLPQINVEFVPDDKFLCNTKEFSDWAGDKKSLRMEFFYRTMRQKYNILMDGKEPKGGKWNFDSENRNKYDGKAKIPELPKFEISRITKEVIHIVEKMFPNHFGDIEPFYPAVTRENALEAMNWFIKNALKHFGTYQDAMLESDAFLFHSILSPYINVGLLHPLEVIKAAEEAYYKYDLPINTVEGFIRQILGWREFIRGIYWLKMPSYKNSNALNATLPLPEFYWNAKTKMNCVSHVVNFTKKYAYSHHIQRLMVTGNLALLMGINPKEVEEWYLLVYLDAFEWVELPNTHGMALYADDGFLGSKPYAASGKYINKMSDFCKNCKYNVNENDTEDACPFNYLYWNFIDKHQEKFSKNQRMSYVYATLNKMNLDKVNKMKFLAKTFLDKNFNSN